MYLRSSEREERGGRGGLKSGLGKGVFKNLVGTLLEISPSRVD